MNPQKLCRIEDALTEALKLIRSEINRPEKQQLKLTVEIPPQTLAVAILLLEPEITVTDLARKVGVNKTTLYRWPIV